MVSHHKKVKVTNILEDKFLKKEVNMNLSKEYFQRLTNILKLKLNDVNLVQGVNA